jgi:ppGpp synthetase/RelA/SpoT-type nucleotidyltranferase
MSLKNQSAIESNNAFMVKIEDLVKEILIQNGIPYYRIESGIQQVQDDNGYMPSVRIVTYFEDTVNKIADVLRFEFDLENMVAADKKGVRLDSFSYKHVQYLAGLKPERQQLTEYKRSASKKFEIQMCSMLQDAWAGIEKELGYDSVTVPDEVKRDFYRVGALLEMADIEFLKIRSQLNKREALASVKKATVAAEQVTATPPAQPVAEVSAQHVEEPVAEVPAPAAEQEKEHQKVELESMDMNVADFNGLAMNVNSINEKNGITDDSLSNIINVGPTDKPVAITPEEQHKDADPVAVIPQEETPATGGNEGVALNIDNIQTFNMNVNGMIEKTTEIIRENNNETKPVPFFEDAPKNTAPVPLDENAPMTDASLKEYVLHSKVLKEVDMQIAERAGAKLNPEIDVEGDVDRLKFLKVFTLKQLHERIVDNSADIVAFAEKWIGKDNGGSFDSGICLFYLEYLLVGKKNDPAFAIEYVVKFISDNDYSARYIIPTYNSIRNAEPASAHAHLTLK